MADEYRQDWRDQDQRQNRHRSEWRNEDRFDQDQGRRESNYGQGGSGMRGAGQSFFGQGSSAQGGFGDGRPSMGGYGEGYYGQADRGQYGGQYGGGQQSFGWRGQERDEDYGRARYGQDFVHDRSSRSQYGQGRYGQGGYGQGGYGQGGYGQGRYENDDDRGFMDKAGDRVASWFGDDDAQRRVQQDRMMEGKHRGRGPKGYRRSDERVREDINDRLSDDPYIDASEIEVTVQNGEVTLTGTVSDRQERRRAEDCAERISGVNHVQNNLRVQQSGGMGMAGGAAQSQTTETTGSNSSARTRASS